jgi:hypothetical protein
MKSDYVRSAPVVDRAMILQYILVPFSFQTGAAVEGVDERTRTAHSTMHL